MDPSQQGTGERSTVGPPARALHALLFDGLADAVLVTDGTDAFVEANLAATKLLGYSRPELLSKSLGEIAGSEAAEATLSQTGGDDLWQSELELRRKDGSTIWVAAHGSTLVTDEGRWGVVVLQELDDTLAEARLGAIVDSSHDAIFSWSTDGTIESWNESAEHLFGYRADEIIGKPLSILAPPERAKEPQQKLARLLRGQRLRDFETIRLRKDGSRVEVSLSVSPIRDPRGQIVGVAEIARDSSSRRRAERRTKVLYQLSEALTHAVSEHEIMDAALDALQRSVGVDRAAVLLVDGDGVMRFRAWRGLSPAYRAKVEGHNPWAGSSGPFEPIHVPDVETDPSLDAVRPTILDEGVRALTFVPLVHLDRLLGKFMMYFDTARSLSEDELRLSVTIAQQVSFSVARLESVAALEAARSILDLITIGSADGITIQAHDGRIVYANLEAARLTGYDTVEAFLDDPATWLDRFELFDEHGNSVSPSELPGRRALLGEPNPEVLLRVRDRLTGSEHWRQIRSMPAPGEEGSVRFAINVFHDVTAERHAQDQLRFQAALLHAQAESSQDGILVVSSDARMVSWNQRYVDLWQLSGDVLEARSDRLVATALADRLLDPASFLARLDELYADPSSDAVDELHLVDGRLIERTTTPLVDELGGFVRGRIWYFRDVTDVRRREATQRMLADASKTLASSLDDESRFEAVLDVVLAWAGDVAALYVAEAEGARLMTIRHADQPLSPAPGVDGAVGRSPALGPPDHPAKRAISGGGPVIIDDITDDAVAEEDGEPFVAWARAAALRGAVFVPIRSRGQVMGALSLAVANSERTTPRELLAPLEELASRIALAFENARLYEERDFVARTLQQGLLPSALPEIPGIEIGTRYRAAGKGVDVGGDFFDAFEMRDDSWGVVVGDVCGKGPASAAFTTVARQSLRSIVMVDDEPTRILRHVNQALLRQGADGQFCTMVFGRIVRSQDEVTISLSAGGHPPPLVLRSGGSIEVVSVRGSLLGMFPDPKVGQREIQLRRGDALVLYTDGVIEERGAGEPFGIERLSQALRGAAGLSADEVADTLLDAVRRWSPEQVRDDIAILAVRVAEPPTNGSNG